MKKYEYKAYKVKTTGLSHDKIDDAEISDGLTALGKEGWELTRTVTTCSGGTTLTVIFILKREI